MQTSVLFYQLLPHPVLEETPLSARGHEPRMTQRSVPARTGHGMDLALLGETSPLGARSRGHAALPRMSGPEMKERRCSAHTSPDTVLVLRRSPPGLWV